MKSKRYDGNNDVYRVLAGMISDDIVCSRISSKWKKSGLFAAARANIIGSWCVNYLRKFGKAPNSHIESKYEQWAELNKDNRKMVDGVYEILSSINDRYLSQDPQLSSDYLLELANKIFNEVRIRESMREIDNLLDRNEVDKAQEIISSLSKIELSSESVIKPGEDESVWEDAFNIDKNRPLVVYPGRLNDFLGEAMVRDSLIAFMGTDKVGKTAWLIDLAYRGMRRSRVAYFEVGDMSRGGVLRRFGQRAARLPIKKVEYDIPTSITKDGIVTSKKVINGPVLSQGKAFAGIKKRVGGRDVFRLSCYPNSSVNVDGISSTIRDWGKEEWIPDIVVIDYADILAPPTGVKENLDQIDVTWKQLRRLSQEFHCLVVTATQSSAAAYNSKQKLLGRVHFSGRKTKLAHVNGMIGLNVSPEDKKKGITRVNWVVKRDGYFNDQQYELAAGCLAIARPVIKAVE